MDEQDPKLSFRTSAIDVRREIAAAKRRRNAEYIDLFWTISAIVRQRLAIPFRRRYGSATADILAERRQQFKPIAMVVRPGHGRKLSGLSDRQLHDAGIDLSLAGRSRAAAAKQNPSLEGLR